jgi:hypothetical protein
MSDTDKKLVLAFPPFSTPLSPPLGVCMLKSYVDQTAPGWSSRVVDLNLLYHEKIFENIDDDSPPLLRGNPLPPIALSRAAESFFREDEDGAFYRRPDRYAAYANLMLNFFGTNATQLSKRLQGAYRNAESMPSVIELFADVALADDPDAVGISICYNEQFWVGMCLAKLIKQRTSVPVIFGGTFFLHDGEKLLVDFEDAIDFVVTGDGENALARLLTHPERPEDVPGLYWRSGQEVRCNPPAFERKLDVLGHPDFSDTDFGRYYSPSPVVPVLTSRGCYWRRCTFCTHYQSSGLTYRLHSIPYVIEELQRHVAAGITHFNLIDEMLSPKRFGQLAEAIQEANLDIHYYAMARPTKDFDADRLQRMYESGCRFIMWGLESGNQRVLDLIEKGTVLSEVHDVLHASAAAGLFNHVFVFFDENKEVIHQVLRGTFQLDRGSPISDHPERFAIKKMQLAGGYPYQNMYAFECSTGMHRKEVQELFAEVVPFLRVFSPFADPMGKYREHALLIYSQLGDKLRAQGRLFPPCPADGARVDAAAAPREESAALPQTSEASRRIDHGLDRVARKWWIAGLATVLVVPLLVYFALRVRHVRKVRRNRSRHPDFELKEFPGFLTDFECEHLIQAADPLIRRRSESKEGSGRWMSQVQKSSTAFLDRDDVIRNIKKKIEHLTGIPNERQEKIQVTHYDPLEYYGPHFDSMGDAPGIKGRSGDRCCTVIIYLNDDFEGGGTFFPELGRRVVPEQGKAVCFYNLTEDGNDHHPLARHVGEVVLSGEKWVCNQWFRQHSFAKPSRTQSPPRRAGSRRGRSRSRRRPHARSR